MLARPNKRLSSSLSCQLPQPPHEAAVQMAAPLASLVRLALQPTNAGCVPTGRWELVAEYHRRDIPWVRQSSNPGSSGNLGIWQFVPLAIRRPRALAIQLRQSGTPVVRQTGGAVWHHSRLALKRSSNSGYARETVPGEWTVRLAGRFADKHSNLQSSLLDNETRSANGYTITFFGRYFGTVLLSENICVQ